MVGTREIRMKDRIPIEYRLPRRSPYPPLEVPGYQEGSVGRWSLMRRALTPQDWGIPGYFSASGPWGDHIWALHYREAGKKKRTWMSITPLERESLAHHALWAHGHTVIMGLGMGLVLYNVLKNPAVTKVTVVERDERIPQLLDIVTEPNWRTWGIFHLVIADALRWRPDDRVNFLTIDIWRGIGDEKLEPDSQRIQRHVCAEDVMAWCQELAYISFCSKNNIPTSSAFQDTSTWKLFQAVTGVPFVGPERDPRYLQWVHEAGMNFALMDRR